MTPKQLESYLGAFADENRAFYADPLKGKALVRWKYQRYMKNYLRCVAGVDRSVGRGTSSPAGPTTRWRADLLAILKPDV